LENPLAGPTQSSTSRRFGYAVAVAVNAAILVVVNNILEWGWFPWLTDDFELVLPLVNLSLVATILANIAYMAYDAAWFKSICEIGQLSISIAVAIRTFRVFPFDFAAYTWDWEATTRLTIVVAIVAMFIAIIVHVVRLIMELVHLGHTHQPSH